MRAIDLVSLDVFRSDVESNLINAEHFLVSIGLRYVYLHLTPPEVMNGSPIVKDQRNREERAELSEIALCEGGRQFTLLVKPVMERASLLQHRLEVGGGSLCGGHSQSFIDGRHTGRDRENLTFDLSGPP